MTQSLRSSPVTIPPLRKAWRVRIRPSGALACVAAGILSFTPIAVGQVTFTPVVGVPPANEGQSHGTAWGDYDGDGQLDLVYVTEDERHVHELFDMVVLSVGAVSFKKKQSLVETLGLRRVEGCFCDTDEIHPLSATR